MTTTARDRPPEEAPEDSSFARGLRVFLAIADRGTMRADELASLLDTPLSTIYRYLRTLTDFGFVDRHEGAYRLGPRLLVGGGSTVSSEELIRRADPILIMLSAETGETAVISRRIGLAAVCLHQQPSDHALRVVLEVGSAAPLGVGALGRVLLAFAPADIQDEVLTNGGGDLGSVPVGIGPAALRSVASEGIALTDGELPAGCVAIAAPVLRDDGIVAAVGVLAPSARATPAWRSRASALVASAAAGLGRSLRAST